LALLSLLQNTSVPALLTADYTTNRYSEGLVGTNVATSLPGFSFSNATGGYSLGGTQSFAANVPRITSSGLLVEAAATNVIPYTTAPVAGTVDRSGGATLTNSAAIAPDGTNTASLITSDATYNFHGIGFNSVFGGTGTNSTTGSVYLKPGSQNYVFLQLYDGTNRLLVEVDLSGGHSPYYAITAGTSSYNTVVTSYPNGWYRVAISATFTTAYSGGLSVTFGDPSNWGSDYFTGSSSSTLYFWGLQVESGLTATSYIPNSTNSFVTRAADVVSQTYSGSATGITVTTAGLGAMTYPAAGVTNHTQASTNLTNATYWNNFGGPTAATCVQSGLGPDNATSAYLITLGTNNGSDGFTGGWGNGAAQTPPGSGVNITMSCWAKVVSGTGKFVYNVSGNVTDTYGPVFTATSTWQRFTSTATIPSFETGINGFNMCPQTDGTNNVPNGVATATTQILFWGPQMEFGVASAGGYVPTTTASATYSPLGALTLGAPTTNLITYSTSLTTNLPWNNDISLPIASAAVVAPDGTTSGVIAATPISSLGVPHMYYQSITGTASAPYTFSYFAKANGDNFVGLVVSDYNDNNGGYAIVNLSTGLVAFTGTFGSGTLLGATCSSVCNGWYRVSISAIASTATSLYPSIWVGPTQAAVQFAMVGTQFAGDGVSGAYFWGPQMEAGTVATGYVPTTSATVTGQNPPWVGQYIKSLGVQQYNYSVSTGSAAGSSSATAVGASSGGTSTLTGTGTAAGAATVTGVGAAILPSVATAAGAGTATGIGVGVNATTGTAAGTSTASAVGSGGVGSSASAAGAATASGVGASTATAAGSSAGVGAASAVGSATNAATATATGASTAAATGLGVAASVGTAAGASSASAGGAYALSGAGTSTGTSSATAGGASTATTTASTAGASTASAIASPTDATTATAAGSSTASAVGVAIGSGAGTASGSSTASAATAVIIAATGTASGTSTAIAYGGTIGQAAGSSTATGVGAATVAQAGSAAGTSNATGAGTALTPGAAQATGSGSATGIGASIATTVASAAGVSTASGLSNSGTSTTATAAGTSTASAVGASVAASPATSAGTSTATGTTAVTIGGAAVAAGLSTATAVGVFTQSSTATAAGLASASAIGAATAAATGTAAGTSTATGFTGIVGTANGSSTATGVGASIVASVTTAAGSSTASAIGQAIAPSTGTVTAASTASATGAATAASPATASGGATVSAVGQAIIASVASAAGAASTSAIGYYYLGSACFANGSSTATAVGASIAASPGTVIATSGALGSGGYVMAVSAFAQGFAAAVAAGASRAASNGNAGGSSTVYGYGLVYFPYVHHKLVGRINRATITGQSNRTTLTGRINRPSLTGISD